MKVGIVGNYGNDNNGDEAILLSIIKQLQETLDISTSHITVFSNNPKQTAARYGVESYSLYYKAGSAVKTFIKTFRENKPVVKRLDLLVIGGGGILMDLYKREAPLYGSYAMMAKQSNTPYVVYGCGAGPLSTSLGKWFIRYMAKHAKSVSVRDPKSKQLLESIGVKEQVDIIGDPAFSLRQVKAQHRLHPKKIGVTAVPYYSESYWPEGDSEKYQTYIGGMAKNLDRLLDAHDVEIHFFATKFPQDADVTKDIAGLMQNKDAITINDQNLPPQAILDVVEDMDVVIGTRLHSLILATDTTTPIIAVSYHKKVRDFMEMANLHNQVVSMDDIAEDDTHFENIFSSLASSWTETQQRTANVSQLFYIQAMKGTAQFTQAVQQKK